MTSTLQLRHREAETRNQDKPKKVLRRVVQTSKGNRIAACMCLCESDKSVRQEDRTKEETLYAGKMRKENKKIDHRDQGESGSGW